MFKIIQNNEICIFLTPSFSDKQEEESPLFHWDCYSSLYKNSRYKNSASGLRFKNWKKSFIITTMNIWESKMKWQKNVENNRNNNHQKRKRASKLSKIPYKRSVDPRSISLSVPGRIPFLDLARNLPDYNTIDITRHQSKVQPEKNRERYENDGISTEIPSQRARRNHNRSHLAYVILFSRQSFRRSHVIYERA